MAALLLILSIPLLIFRWLYQLFVLLISAPILIVSILWGLCFIPSRLLRIFKINSTIQTINKLLLHLQVEPTNQWTSTRIQIELSRLETYLHKEEKRYYKRSKSFLLDTLTLHTGRGLAKFNFEEETHKIQRLRKAYDTLEAAYAELAIAI